MEVAALVGRQVGDFRLLEEVGQGGMGTTYRAEQVGLAREAIIKVISHDSVTEDARVRFLREARLASRLDHPYAAHVYAFGAEADGLLWIAMELVRGMPLDRMLAVDGAMPLARFVPFFDRLCEVVYSAHEQGIIHRDIKPANVMVVRRAGRLLPKLLDFGIARTVLDVSEPSGEAAGGELVDSPLDAGSRSVTMRGNVVGSPDYMAPEQWVDAKRATPRTDLYALAITAYEMLTGKRPFSGPTVMAIAKAHARNDVPALGPQFPAGLDQVFARALAKKEAQRYENVLELGAAIRDAARDETRASADLDEVVRDVFIQSGPQPLAETLLELAAARTPEAAWDGAWRVVDVVARLLGVIAMASRARIGDRAMTGATAARVRALFERGLDTEEWLELAAALVEPFAGRSQAHPIPELVEVFADRAVFAALRERRRATDAIDQAQVAALLGELARMLRACAFLTDYEWVCGGELWRGPRRLRRERQELPASAPADSIWLVDGDGAPVMELSPLARVVPPAPGAEDELFIVDGPAKRGARMVAWPRELERFDDELWRHVSEQLAPLEARATVEEGESAPYRGLASFNASDAAMFFGREREVEAVTNRLRMQPLIAVVGPSGVGKSSFVHAGVLPALPESWQALSLRPGASPLGALETQLASAGIAATGLAERLRAEPRALDELLEQAARRQGAHIVVVIDQLEELFTQCRDVETRDTFARALAAIGRGDSPVRIVFTLRDDFLVRAAELPELGPRLSSSLELVTLPDPDALRRIVLEPLRRVGYAFESQTLPDEMVASVREHSGALALLSFAAAKLWELRDRNFRHIPRRAYEAIGGVAGALARHAEDTLSALPQHDHALVRELFRHLVTSEGTRATLTRDEAIQLLRNSPAAERVIETLVGRRLLVGYDGETGERIEVIHEALLTAWPRLVAWQREDAESARLRDQVRSTARQWGERGRPKGLLWRGEALVELKLWRSRHDAALTDLELAFTNASIADDVRVRRLRRIALAAVIAGLVIGLVVLRRSSGIAEHNAAQAQRTTRAMLVEQGRAALVSNHPQEAMAYLSEAYSNHAEDPNLPFLLGEAARTLRSASLVLRGHVERVKWLAYTPDGGRLLSASFDGTTRVWNMRDGVLEHVLPNTGTSDAVSGRLPRPTLLPGGRLLTSGSDTAPTVWDIATGRALITLPLHGAAAIATSDGATILTLEPNKLRTWNADGTPRGERVVATAAQLRLAGSGTRYAIATPDGVAVGDIDLAAPPKTFPTARPPRIFLGANGTRVITIVEPSRDLELRDVEHLDAPITLAGHSGDAVLAEMSPDGTRVATTSFDGTVRVWDATTGRMVATLAGHEHLIPVAWSADGKSVAAGGFDRTARVWDARTSEVLGTFYDQTDYVYSVAFDPTGKHLVTGSHDGSIALYELADISFELDLHHSGPVSLRFSGDERRLLAVAYDGPAWLYDLEQHVFVAELTARAPMPSVSRIETLDLRHCGDVDASGSRFVVPFGTEVRVVTVADRDHPVTLGPHPDEVTCARFLPDGRIAASTANGLVVLWRDRAVDRVIDVGRARITGLEIDRDGRRLAVAADVVAIVDLVDPTAPVTIGAKSSVFDVAIAPDTRTVATAGMDTYARLLDARGDQRASFHAFTDLSSIAFSLDGHRIAVAGRGDSSVTVHDALDARLLARYPVHGGWPTAVAYAGRRAMLAEADDTGIVHLWSVADETRSPAEVARTVECHVPFAVVDGQLVERDPRPCTREQSGDVRQAPPPRL